MAALPFAKFGLERGGQDEESQSAVFPLCFEPENLRLKDAIYQADCLVNPTAEPKFGSLTASGLLYSNVNWPSAVPEGSYFKPQIVPPPVRSLKAVGKLVTY